MMRAGLTGGIACGKSTVARMFSALGARLIDADLLSRQLVEPGSEALALLCEHFGPAILQEGVLNRRALGQIVFQNEAERSFVNAVLHPRIHQAALKLAEQIEALGQLAIYDAPLLFEVGADKDFHPVVTVYSSRAIQIERLCKRDQFSKEEAELRLNAQMSCEEKARRADYVIVNDGGLEALQQKTALCFEQLKRWFTHKTA